MTLKCQHEKMSFESRVKPDSVTTKYHSFDFVICNKHNKLLSFSSFFAICPAGML